MSPLNKDFIPYEEALALKELRFDEACSTFYKLGDSELYYDTILQSQKVKFRNNTELNAYGDLKEKISAPSYQQAFRFLREKAGLEGVVQRCKDFPHYKFQVNMYLPHIKTYLYAEVEFNSYEAAQLACLKHMLKRMSNFTKKK